MTPVQMRRSISTKLYNVLRQGTEQGLIEWEYVLEDNADEKGPFATTAEVAGHQVEVSYLLMEDPTDTDKGYRWVITHGETEVVLNLKQKVLARSIVESIEGTAEQKLREEADNLADNLADAFGFTPTSADVDDDDDDESEDNGEEEVNAVGAMIGEARDMRVAIARLLGIPHDDRGKWSP